VIESEAMAGEAYMRQLRAHPLRTKAVTSGVLAGCSDAIAQKIAGAKKLQLRRLLLITVPATATATLFCSSRFLACFSLLLDPGQST
jgi:peroxisomal membrane protein 2/protein Mpv17